MENMSESGNDPQAFTLLQWAGILLWYICRPVGIVLYYTGHYVAVVLLSIARLIWLPLAFLLLPVVYLGQFLLTCLAAPFRLLAKFETIYIYLGVAALVGITGGLVLSYTYAVLRTLLQLDSGSEPPGRTARQYRREKQKRKAMINGSLISSGHLSPGSLSLSDGARHGKRGKSLVSQTILEEVDSDY